MTLKSILASVAVAGAAVAAAAPALSQTAPQLSDAEKKTLSTHLAFQNCVVATFPKVAGEVGILIGTFPKIGPAPMVDRVQTLLSEANYSPKAIGMLIFNLGASLGAAEDEQDVIKSANLLASIFASAQCTKEMAINPNEFPKELSSLMQKYGPAILQPAASVPGKALD